MAPQSQPFLTLLGLTLCCLVKLPGSRSFSAGSPSPPKLRLPSRKAHPGGRVTLSNHVPIAGHRPQTRSQGPALRSGDSTEGLAEEQARRAVNRQTEAHANSVAPPRHPPPPCPYPSPQYRTEPPHQGELCPGLTMLPLPTPAQKGGTEAPRGLWPGLPPKCNLDLPPPLSRLQLPRGHHSGAGVGQRPRLSQPGARLLCEGLGGTPPPRTSRRRPLAWAGTQRGPLALLRPSRAPPPNPDAPT